METLTSGKIIKDKIKEELSEKNNPNLHISPINTDVLMSVKKSFKNKVEINTLVGAYNDNSNNAIILFSGEKVYIKNKNNEFIFKYQDIAKLEYFISERSVNIILSGENQDKIELHGEMMGDKCPLRLVSELLTELQNPNIEKVALNQLPEAENLSNKSKLIYLKILSTFLKSDDGVIDAEEYKELYSILANLKVDKEVVDEFRKYQYNTENEDNYEILLKELEVSLVVEDGIEPAYIKESLAKDIVNMQKKEALNNWKNISHLADVFNSLNINAKQVDSLIILRNKQREMLEKRLNNDEFQKHRNELVSVLGGVGLSYLGVFVIGATGIGAVLGAGYLGYRATKLLFNNDSEKYAIQIELLRAEKSKLAETIEYIITDINYLNERNKVIIAEAKNNKEFTSERMVKELEKYLAAQSMLTKSSMNVIAEQEQYGKEILLRQLPEKLDANIYDDLAIDNINYDKYNDIIYSVYIQDYENIYESETLSLVEESEFNLLQKAYAILEEVGYSKESVNAKIKVKETTGNIKNSEAIKKGKEAVDNIKNSETIKKGLGKFKSFLK